MRILVVTRSYPAHGDLYQYPFVHRRVLGYIAAGHDVAVFRPAQNDEPVSYEFEGVTWHSGNSALFRRFVESFSPEVIAAHGFDERMHEVLNAIDYTVPTRAWLYGSEIPGFFRAKALAIASPAERERALAAVEARRHFWQAFLDKPPENFRLVFISKSSVQLFREDIVDGLSDGDFAVIPIAIDTDLFRYRKKAPEDRFRILMIRPFDSWTYGNDLAVSAIARLSGSAAFDRLNFTIIGDGPLFDETLAPLPKVANVRVERRFLTQAQIAEQHGGYGIFLVPTRLDTQGVSRDEAMASGLVPVTNRVSAVPEFVDESCAGLAAPDDAEGLAAAIQEMIDSPELFLARSVAAAERVRRQSGHQHIIPTELALLADAATATALPGKDRHFAA